MQTRLASKIEVGDCWQWTGTMLTNGYGYARRTTAHRAVWEELVGPIPEGMVLDHLCRNTRCVNPDHLEVVSQSTNVRRGHNRNRGKTRCVHGHSLTDPANVTLRGRQRRCRACHRNEERKRRSRL